MIITKTRLAESDLDEIWFHIAADNPAAADTTLLGIERRYLMLAGHPDAGRQRPDSGTACAA